MKKFTLFCAFLLALCLCGKVFAAVQTASMAQPYVFTDEQAIINCSGIVGPVAYSIRTFVATGWGPTAELTGDVTDGHLAIKPLAEGIHIVTLKLPTPLEVRFLAMTPPPSIDRAALLRAIPRHGKQLLDGQPCKLVTMGDSITTTGDYKTMLVLMLQRATGNKQITVVNRGRYGMTIDYNVRIMQTIEDDHPDIGLLMYGLNDQHALDPAAYLEQYRYVCDTLAKTCNTDMVILQPTPDFNIPLTAGDRNAGSNPDWYAFRGIGYAESLRTMATQMHLPLAETFQGIWGDGGKTMADAFRNNIAKFPLDASMQLTSILERDQHDGDHVHVNALGQLMIAHAAFAAISGEKVPAQPLTFSAVSEWTPSGLITNVTMRNTSTVAREGTIVAYPLLESAVTMDAPENYNLTPGQTATFTVRWPQLLKAEDLLKFPNDKYFLAMPPRLPLVDYSGNGSHVYAPAIPFAVTTTFVRERQVVSGSRVMVTLKTGNFR